MQMEKKACCCWSALLGNENIKHGWAIGSSKAIITCRALQTLHADVMGRSSCRFCQFRVFLMLPLRHSDRQSRTCTYASERSRGASTTLRYARQDEGARTSLQKMILSFTSQALLAAHLVLLSGCVSSALCYHRTDYKGNPEANGNYNNNIHRQRIKLLFPYEVQLYKFHFVLNEWSAL